MASQRLSHASVLANRDNSQPNEPYAGALVATIGDGVSRPSKRDADVGQRTCHSVPYLSWGVSTAVSELAPRAIRDRATSYEATRDRRASSIELAKG